MTQDVRREIDDVDAAPQDEPARLRVRLDEARFELQLAHEVRRRLEGEVQRLEGRLAEVNSDRATLRTRLDERERYVDLIQRSAPWRLAQALRGLFGRRW